MGREIPLAISKNRRNHPYPALLDASKTKFCGNTLTTTRPKTSTEGKCARTFEYLRSELWSIHNKFLSASSGQIFGELFRVDYENAHRDLKGLLGDHKPPARLVSPNWAMPRCLKIVAVIVHCFKLQVLLDSGAQPASYPVKSCKSWS